MSNPVIGLTTYNGENKYGHPIAALTHKYIEAVNDAGGVAVLIPSGLKAETLNSLLGRLDGVLLTGGGDIAIERFEGEPHPRVHGVDSDRDEVEFSLLITQQNPENHSWVFAAAAN